MLATTGSITHLLGHLTSLVYPPGYQVPLTNSLGAALFGKIVGKGSLVLLDQAAWVGLLVLLDWAVGVAGWVELSA